MPWTMLRSPIAALLGAALAGPALAGEVVVRVTGVGPGGGEVGCSLHAGPAQFPMGHAGVPTLWLRADPAGVTCRFPGVAPGSYAVAVAHDLNGNRETDTNLLGLPQEDWGVSNDVRPNLRAPRFEEAAFAVREGAPTTLTVRLAR